MPAEVVGVNKIVNNLQRYSFDEFEIYRGKNGKSSVHHDTVGDNQDENDLIERFEDWANSLLESEPNNFQIYSMQLFESPDGSKKRRGTVNFTFQLTEQPAGNRFKKREGEAMNGDYVHKDTMLLAIENANLQNKLAMMEQRLTEIENDNQDDDFDEVDTSIGGALQSAIQDKLPQLIDLAIGMLTNTNKQTSNLMNTAIGSNIDQIITEFRTINPNIESDLFKLLQLAKTKPELFKMLIQQLRSM